MTLRKKTLLIVGLTLGVLFIGLIVASWTIVLGGFEDQESQDTRTNVERVLGALDDDLRRLRSRPVTGRNGTIPTSTWKTGTRLISSPTGWTGHLL